MRISDWSSDVCSSDLIMTKTFIRLQKGADAGDAFLASSYADMAAYPPSDIGQKHGFVQFAPQEGESPEATAKRLMHEDRQSVVEGKSVSVRVDLGGRRLIKKKKKKHK